MCFSTAASFGAGALLTGATILAARKSQKSVQWALVAIPGIFAIQQFTEGFVWLSLTNESYAGWSQSATFWFLFFAQVYWPAWIPLAMVLVEKDRWRRQILFSLLGLGLVLSSYSIYSLLAYPIHARVWEYHIQYWIDTPPYWTTFVLLVYGLVTVAPTFFSSVPRMWWLGITIAGSYFISLALFPHHIVSVWCYFAAIISVLVILVLSGMSTKTKVRPEQDPL